MFCSLILVLKTLYLYNDIIHLSYQTPPFSVFLYQYLIILLKKNVGNFKNSDLTRKYITPTFKTGYSSEGNRGYITLSGKIVTVNLGVYSDAGYGAGEVVASIPAEYAPTLAFATGCYIGSAIDKIESVGYAYINTAGEILIADSNFTKRKIARLVVTYQIA